MLAACAAAQDAARELSPEDAVQLQVLGLARSCDACRAQGQCKTGKVSVVCAAFVVENDAPASGDSGPVDDAGLRP